MKGVCVSAEGTTTLQQGQEYFLFPASKKAVYVSRFKNEGAHFGCYQASRFQIIEQPSWPPEPPAETPQLQQDTLYRAQLIWRASGYRGKPLKEYFIQASATHCYFWHDRQQRLFCGSFPLHWFTGFEAVGPVAEESVRETAETVPKPAEIELFERTGGQLSFF